MQLVKGLTVLLMLSNESFEEVYAGFPSALSTADHPERLFDQQLPMSLSNYHVIVYLWIPTCGDHDVCV